MDSREDVGSLTFEEFNDTGQARKADLLRTQLAIVDRYSLYMSISSQLLSHFKSKISVWCTEYI